MINKIKRRKRGFKWHLWLAWLAAFGLLCFTISALTHPLMAWTGPQAKAFRPPQAVMQASDAKRIPAILAQHNIQRAVMVKLVPSKLGVVLQVTQDAQHARRYFDLQSGAELADFDKQQAIWLARYYLFGAPHSTDSSPTVESVVLQTQFDHAYPWVNRLLPVYKVTFAPSATSSPISTYVYTEINALAGVSNAYKTTLQTVFRNIHTWAWLDRVEYARVIIMAGLILSIFGMAISGLMLVIGLKRRVNMSGKARWHRTIANVVVIPILAFCISGFLHLLHNAQLNKTNPSTAPHLQLGAAMDMSQLMPIEELPNASLNQLAVVQYQGELLYRMSLPTARTHAAPSSAPSAHSHHDTTRNQRFDGQPSERGGRYFSATTGQRSTANDRAFAMALAASALSDTQITNAQVTNAKPITRFSADYDFRNKRLPVWQVDFDRGDSLFVDPATGAIVDRLTPSDRVEGLVFSYLHKWNFLTPFIGRMWRDALVVLMLSLTILLTILGLIMRIKR